MNRIAFLTGIFILTFCTYSFAQPASDQYAVYRNAGFGNPIDTPFVIAGTFGEIRENHFHSGIDFSTKEVTGKPVYAAGDGYISRIKISSSGFGKTLYITHPNGFVTVYAHLQNFSEPVEKMVHKIQYKNESFEIDEAIDASKFKVKKGSVIALSGNSGSSTGPHLHFEIRDERTEEPINPMLFGYQIPDTVKPVIKAVRFYPVAGQGVVVDADRPRTYEVVQSPQGLTIPVTDYIQVFGKIGFEFSLTDYQNNNTASLGIYSIQLAVDTQQVFSMKYDRINYDDMRYVNAHIDYEAYYEYNEVYERCFRLSGDKLKLYGDTSSTGFFEFLEDGVHDVSLTVKDFNGNTTNFTFQLLSYSSLVNAEYQTQPQDYFAMLPDKGLAIHKSDMEVIIPANSIYEVLLFTNSQLPARTGFYSSTFMIGEPEVPLHKTITLSLKPQNLPETLKAKAVVVSFSKKNKPVYEGSEWKNEFLSCNTKHFGTFAISVDTIPPAISVESLPQDQHKDGHALRLKITDDLSGIKNWRVTIDGKWYLMDYDQKNNLLTGKLDEFPAGKMHTMVATVTDVVGNTTTLTKEVAGTGK
jgi:hypothetical protein